MPTSCDDPPPLPPVQPVRPDDDECCHGGCESCVFDLYEIEMERYRAALKAWEKHRDGKNRAGK